MNKNTIKVCPICREKDFTRGAVEYHTWRVDADGEFIEDLGCNDIGDTSEIWCNTCDTALKNPIEVAADTINED